MPSNGQQHQRQQSQQHQLVLHLMRACCSSSREAGRRLRGAPTVSCESAASTVVPEPLPAAAAAVCHRDSPSTSSDFPVTASSSSLRLSPDTPAGSSSCQSDFVSPFTQSPLSEVSASWSNGHQPGQQQQLQKQQQQRIERALLALCSEFEQRLRSRFADFDDRLDTRPETAQDFVMRELDSLFADGCVNWGRVVAAFVLARQLCFKCEAEGNPQLATDIQAWVGDYIQDRLWPWVANNQGWLGLAQFYEDSPGTGAGVSDLLSETLQGWSPLAPAIIALAAVSIAVMVTISLMRR